MPELRNTRAVVVTCVADPSAIDAVIAAVRADAVRADALRVAPDEVLLVADADAPAVVARAEAVAADADGDALVLDASDGWSIWTIEGAGAGDAFARLSHLHPVVGFAQGEVGHLPAKVDAAPSRIRILVPSMWREAMRDRILADCADLGVREADAVSWTATP